MPDSAVAAHENGVRHALDAGWAVLARGGCALDAVGSALEVLENDDTFDAAHGSFLTRDGRVQCDALLMSGADLRAGGVACVERLRNPIHAARLVLERSPHVYFVGPGAEVFAASQGMPLIENSALVIPREQARLRQFLQDEAAGLPDTTFAGTASVPSENVSGASESIVILSEAKDPLSRQPIPASLLEDSALTQTAVDDVIRQGLPTELQFDDPTLHSHDTVGAVALDAAGNLAAGTSTGGTLAKTPGRVGDSSLIGCGCYADNEAAAVSLTGWGEPIMKLVLGKWATDRVAAGSTPQQAATDAIAYLYDRLGGHGGLILLGPHGEIGIAHNTPRMAWGYATAEVRQLGTDRRVSDTR